LVLGDQFFGDLLVIDDEWLLGQKTVLNVEIVNVEDAKV
jgi:hypothetical protein